MKKFLLIILFFTIFSTTFAINENCFKYSGIIISPENRTIKVITDNDNYYYFQNGNLLNTKVYNRYYDQIIKYFSFFVDEIGYLKYSHNFDQYDTNKELILSFDETLPRNRFQYTLDTNNKNYHFEISKDGQNWQKIEDKISNYDLDYLKIVFDNEGLKNTEIYELGFYEIKTDWKNEILVNSALNNDIKVFSFYNCDDKDLTNLVYKTRKTQYFPIDINTKTYNLEIGLNPNYRPIKVDWSKVDSDNDGIPNVRDNCKYAFNPDQLDSTASGVGDICSDKDNDGISGEIDNCSIVYNPKQEDENKNGIGDLCETDTDLDGFFDVIDNCPLIENSDQFDSDGDGIGDICDNCPEKWNMDQTDIDKDGIGDICDEKDDRYIESNRGFFIGLIITIVIIFLVLIGSMVTKLEKNKK